MQRSFRCALCFMLCLATVAIASAAEVYLYDTKWGSYGSGNGQFNGNIYLYVRGDRLYADDCNTCRVQTFTLDGDYLTQFGSYGHNAGQFAAARDLVNDTSGNFFVLDSEDDRFTVFSAAFLPLFARGGSGTGANQFDAPWHLAINDSTGMLYITDMLNKRVSQWTTGGTFQRLIGSAGTGDGQFQNPVSVAVHPTSGEVYVGDTSTRRIQVFSADGGYQRQFTIGPAANPGYPEALAFLADGHLLVADVGYGCVRKCTAYGTQAVQFGATGTADGMFSFIDDVGVDAEGRVYVSDGATATSRIQRFRHNYLPTAVASISIAPKPPHDSDSLSAKISPATDADADPLTYRYQWYYSTNNSTWNKSKASRILPASYTTVGQYWRVKTRAYDGTSYGPWKTSATIRIVADATPALALSAAAPRDGSCVVALSAAAAVSGTLTNLAGRTVATLAPRTLPRGQAALTLPALSNRGTKLPAGQYLLHLTAAQPDGQTARQTLLVPVR